MQTAYFCAWRCNCTDLQQVETDIALRCQVHDAERLGKPTLEHFGREIELGFEEQTACTNQQ